ncbi:MAG: hypothetical protein K5863_09175 [Nitratireductor sp.]|uniref:hypothetical protein n=1 Tax=Nitratireductor sp. TaxID=1872084 RepID=UPI00261A3D3C|nr:hypothetical protein [Nitratireductor sp.]MCV0350236.1 hypothetical protein [Nitratireductor sp.]
MMSAQETWITLRFKGEIPIELDAQDTAEKLLVYLQNCIQHDDGQTHGFEYVQPGDVIEVEEEAQIYDLSGEHL